MAELTETDLKALRAKDDREVAGELFVEVKGYIHAQIAPWREYSPEERDCFAGEAFLDAIRSFQAGRAPFLAFLAFKARMCMRSAKKLERRKGGVSTVSTEQPIGGYSPEGEPLTLRDVLESREPDPSEAADRESLREAISHVIHCFTPTPSLRVALATIAFEGVTQAEAAARAGIDPSYVSQVLPAFRAFARQHSALRGHVL